MQREITDSKRAEMELRESEEKYRRLIETTSTGYVILNDQGRVTDANREYAHLTGREDLEDVIGHNVLEWTAPHDLDRNAAEVRKCIEQGFVRNLEIDYITPSGKLNHVEINATVFHDQGALRILTLCRDITERKRSEEVLQQSERRLRRAEEVAKIGSWEFLLDENKVKVSEGASAIYGLGTKEWSISDVQRIPLPKYRSILDRALKDLIERGATYNVEFKIRRPTDDEIIDILALAEYDAAKNVVFGVIQDITERVRTEKDKDELQAQLLEAQKMESVGRLAGGVAHDFNNMLSAILGHTELAMMQCSPSERIRTDLKAIEKSALRSVELVRQLLAFARRQTVAPKVLDMNDRVTGMLKMLQRLIGEDIDLVWKPNAGLWQVKIDPSQIDQVLANLCVNARDAIPGVGKVTIETENTIFDEAYCAVHTSFMCGEYVMLAVSDDGSGMRKEVLDHLFEPFFTTKEVGKGTGLGLATVYGIVKQNEGFINVYSEPGNGSTFRIYLPRFAGEAIIPAAAEAKETPKGCGETILLVEDETAILNVGRAMLESLGYKVLTAGTPSEALSLAKANTTEIQLLITDVVMPEMNGWDLAKLIDDIKPGLKCLFTSGYTADVIAHRGVLDEGVYFLQKPFSMRDLAFKVHEMLEHE